MFMILAALAASASLHGEPATSVQSKNDEFIFSKYPPRALAAGEQGAVRFRADVNPKGVVLACEVTQSSGFERLDNETCELIVRHATFKPTLDQSGKALAVTHDGIVNWRIPGREPSAPPIKLVEAKPADKLICKRVKRTGSLVAHSRLCLTARNWDRYAEQNQEVWGDLQGKKGHTNAGMATWSTN